jgi:hypothetical protein
MKKTICLFIVLAMVSVADAAVIDVTIASLNGQPITPTREITITPGDLVDFQITFNAPTSEYLFNLGVRLNVTGPGTLDWSGFMGFDDCWVEPWLCDYDVHPDFDPDLYADGYDWVCAGVSSARGLRGNGTEYWVVKDIQIQCNGVGDVYLWLSDYAPCGGTIVIDTNYNQVPWEYGPGVIIHQVPACWLCPGQPFGDASGDGNVGLMDLLALKRAWLTTSAGSPRGTGLGQYNCCADFTQDGSVDLNDLLILKRSWMKVYGTCGDISCP